MATATMKTQLRVENLCKTFVLHNQNGAALPVLQDASLEVSEGECVVLHGHSGSGKSTLLRALAGLVRAQGNVTLEGQELQHASLAERARRIVYLPQALPAAVHLRVIESLLAARRASPHTTRPQQAGSPDAVT